MLRAVSKVRFRVSRNAARVPQTSDGFGPLCCSTAWIKHAFCAPSNLLVHIVQILTVGQPKTYCFELLRQISLATFLTSARSLCPATSAASFLMPESPIDFCPGGSADSSIT